MEGIMKRGINIDKSTINKNDTGRTVIKTISKDTIYPNNSYMLISKGGTVVVIDPFNVVEGIKPDLITSTHNHFDHMDNNLDAATSCKKSYYTVENFEVKDVKVSSIASSHMGDEIDKNAPTNVIYIFEVDGLRIAHMGDIGQTELTQDQLKALGKIDIAFMQFDNNYSDYSLENEKGFKLIEQLKPQTVIPTHSTEAATKKIGSIIGALETIQDTYEVSKSDLKDRKRKVVVINNTLAK
jgi:L-ascorbate metabolism protein UlaG (beta-lactamase superfamily)